MGIKKQLILMTIILLLLAGRVNASGDACEIINTGKWTIDELNVLIVKASKIKDSSLGNDFISRQFLRLPYQEKTLVGGVQTPEVLTINLAGVDCFTLLDYVEAMQLSASFDDFKGNLKKIRYQSGIVDCAVGTAIGYFMGFFQKMEAWQIPLVIIVFMLLISAPSMAIAWLKLRKRNLGPILDANGWAVNARAKMNVPFGGALTGVAELPAGATLRRCRSVRRETVPVAQAADVLVCGLVHLGVSE